MFKLRINKLSSFFQYSLIRKYSHTQENLLPLTHGSDNSPNALRQATRELLEWRGDWYKTIQEAVQKDQEFPMGYALLSIFELMAGV